MSRHKSIIHDPHAERMGKGKVGIVGESHIWDGPLSQRGRLHGVGSSSGITGMHLKKLSHLILEKQYYQFLVN